MTTAKESMNIFSMFFRTIRKMASITLTVILTTYLILIMIVYILQFLTWEPIIQIAHIPSDSVQKFQQYQSNLIDTFVYLPQKK
jgi:hypothetical protein